MKWYSGEIKYGKIKLKVALCGTRRLDAGIMRKRKNKKHDALIFSVTFAVAVLYSEFLR